MGTSYAYPRSCAEKISSKKLCEISYARARNFSGERALISQARVVNGSSPNICGGQVWYARNHDGAGALSYYRKNHSYLFSFPSLARMKKGKANTGKGSTLWLPERERRGCRKIARYHRFWREVANFDISKLC